MATFSEWTERLKVYNDYIRALAEHKLKTAQAELVLAEAQHVLAMVEAKRLVIRELERQFQKLKTFENKTQKTIEQFEMRSNDCQNLLDGDFLASIVYTRARAGYKFFLNKALIESPDSLLDIEVPANARPASNFVNCRTQGGTTDPLPEDETTAIGMMEWMFENRYVAKTGRPAQRTVLKLVKAIDSCASSAVTTMKSAIKAMSKDTYDTWKPVEILGIEVDATAKSIESAGATA